MIKEILKKYGVEPAEDISDEDAKNLLEELIDAKNTQISQLESERDTLSKDKEELTNSVEGYKTSEENLSKELSETKTKLASTEGKLEQVTEMYKEQFTKDPNKEQEVIKEDKDLKDDVLQAILGTK